jgi:hypothetical protein
MTRRVRTRASQNHIEYTPSDFPITVRIRRLKPISDRTLWSETMDESAPAWLRPRPKTRAIICDIDDTICTQFDRPIPAAIQFLLALDRSIEVHYVTARPEASRAGTEQFLADHRLPGWRKVYYCPSWQSSSQHKAEVIARLAKEFRVLVSIGDHHEEERASLDANVPFVRISEGDPTAAWIEAARRVGGPET